MILRRHGNGTLVGLNIMTEIAAASVGTQLQTSILALKQQLQREADVLDLVKQAAEPVESESDSASSTSGGALVDILV